MHRFEREKLKSLHDLPHTGCCHSTTSTPVSATDINRAEADDFTSAKPSCLTTCQERSRAFVLTPQQYVIEPHIPVRAPHLVDAWLDDRCAAAAAPLLASMDTCTCL